LAEANEVVCRTAEGWGGRVPNRLVTATSPCLVQHAEHPVDGHEWGEEALAEARGPVARILTGVLDGSSSPAMTRIGTFEAARKGVFR
jgi:Protein of unknown function, DUF255